jgi:four helix bundle suffix protein
MLVRKFGIEKREPCRQTGLARHLPTAYIALQDIRGYRKTTKDCEPLKSCAAWKERKTMGKMRNSGGYRELRTFQTATVIYDATYWFCETFLDARSRTVDQQIEALEAQFIEGGGYSEQLATARLAERNRKHGPSDPIPPCPQCGKPMTLRTAKTGKNEGQQFWGCTAYPECKGVVNI